jgi:hypothetical protein
LFLKRALETKSFNAFIQKFAKPTTLFGKLKQRANRGSRFENCASFTLPPAINIKKPDGARFGVGYIQRT